MSVPRRAGTAVAAALVLLLDVTDAFAARTDIVVLRNGDRLTCEVQQMRQGKLQVKTDDAGTISIEWDKIASLTTADQYEVTLQNGSQLLGRLRPGTVARTMQVEGIGGTASPSMGDVASIAQIKRTVLQRIDGSIDLGGSYTKSSGVAELSFNAQAKYRRPTYAYGAVFSTNLTRQEDHPETTRYSLTTTYSRYRSAWIFSTLGLFESNRDLGFTFRGTLAESVGHYLARTPHAELLLAGGLAGGRETPVDGAAKTNVDALVVSNLSVFTYDFPTTRLDLSLLVFPSLDDPGRVRVNADAKFKREILRDFFVSLTAYDAFDSRPKSAGATQNDFGGSLSFGWSF
jgi:hypothetical protein